MAIWVPDNYSTIQAAIDAASPRDVIYVRNGTYHENLVANKTVSLIGEDPETTTIDGSHSTGGYGQTVWIYGAGANDFVLSNFTVRGSTSSWGVYVIGSSNVTVENDIIINNHGGMIVDDSYNNTISNNTIQDNVYEGLFLFQSSENSLRNNTMKNNTYNFGIYQSSFDNDIDQSNLVNEKPIYYLINQTNITIDQTTLPKIGYLALINCSSMTVESLSLADNYNGIVVDESENVTLTNNTFARNSFGIDMHDSTSNVLTDNFITGNWQGIVLANSPRNTLRQNNLTMNLQHIAVTGSRLNDFLQDIDTTNTVDMKLPYYLTNQTDLIVNAQTFPNIGYLALVNCRNITAETLSIQNNVLLTAFSQNCTLAYNNLTEGTMSLQYTSNVLLSHNRLVNSTSGITLSDSDNNTITMNSITNSNDTGMSLDSASSNLIYGNNVAKCKTGIQLHDSSNNSIIGNEITFNRDYGLLLTDCHYNTIYHNNLINNSRPGWQAVSSSIPIDGYNTWDNGYPSGGNYWSDYNGTDQKSGSGQTSGDADGIEDTPYHVNFGEIDRYPLAGEYHGFSVEAVQAYDVELISNSSIANMTIAIWLSSPTPYLQPGQQFLMFEVSGSADATGFCRATIPRALVNGTLAVLVDWNPVQVRELPESNNTHSFLYFTYGPAQHEIAIVPEYTTMFFATALIAVTLVFAAGKLRRQRYSSHDVFPCAR